MALDTTNKIDVNRSTSGVALPKDVLQEVWQGITEGSAVMTLARSMAIPGTGVTVNVITGDPEPAWVTESTEKPVSAPKISNKVMQPYKLAVIVPFSNEFRRDVPTLYDAIVQRVPSALARKFDETVFFGDAPGTNFDVLKDVDASDMKEDPAGAINGAMTDIAVAGGAANGLVMAPQGYGILSGAKDSSGNLVFAGSYNASTGAITPFGLTTLQRHAAYKADVSTGDTVGFVGDWTRAIVGTVQDVTVDFSDQATINDGTRQVNLWQRNMFALRCEMEVGFVVEDAKFFQRLTSKSGD